MSTVCSKCKEIGPPPKQDDGPTGGDDYNAALEMRTVAGPSSVVQCVFNGGPYTTASHVRQCQLVCPPPPCPRQTKCPTRTWFGPRVCPFGQRVGGWVIHFPAVLCTSSLSTTTSLRPSTPRLRFWDRPTATRVVRYSCVLPPSD